MVISSGQYRLGGFDLTLNDPRTIANVQYILQYFAGNHEGYPNLNSDMYRVLGDFSDTSGNKDIPDTNITISDVQYMLQNFAGNTAGYPKVGEYVYLPLGTEPDPPVTLFPNMANDIYAKFSYNAIDRQITFSLKYTESTNNNQSDDSGINFSMIQGVCIEFDQPSTDPSVASLTQDVSGGKFYNIAEPGTSAMGYGKAVIIQPDNQLTSDWKIIDVIPYSPAPKIVKSQIVKNVPLQTEGGTNTHNLILGTCVSIRHETGNGDINNGQARFVDYAYGIKTENIVVENMTFAPYFRESYPEPEPQPDNEPQTDQSGY
tara:strand:- start:455 stop:1405 length:951 start_codon:yes stop_codon:yes gene_type:complete